MDRRVFEMYSEGFERRRAFRALKEVWRFSTSASGRDAAAGEFGKITGLCQLGIENMGRVRRTAFTHEIGIPLVPSSPSSLAILPHLPSFFSRDSASDIEGPSMQHQLACDG